MKYFFVLIIFVTTLFYALSYADTHNAASCSYADVTAAIALASAGDTVYVPSGDCTWTTGVIRITVPINLIGAGSDIGGTNITNSYSCSTSEQYTYANFLISFDPSDYSSTANFRLSGFSFDFGATCQGVLVGGRNKTQPLTVYNKVRIDHNIFTNPRNYLMYNSSTAYGVVDNNVFTSGYPIRADGGLGVSWWSGADAVTFSYGSQNVLYFEDNTFNGVYIVSNGQYLGRYVFRYNTIDYVPVAEQANLGWDLHGNQTGGMYTCFGGEVYGNKITTNESIYVNNMKLVDHRGGKMLIFGNNTIMNSGKSYYIAAREEFADNVESQIATNSVDGQTQHVSLSYYWGNRKNTTGALATVEETDTLEVIAENVDYWYQGASFDGTTGVGCGTLAARPATCTTGVGYWATNQSCSDLTGMVGANPTSPISGTLYKCTSTDTWTAYYTPYTYPHPLRGEVSVDVPYMRIRLGGQ